MSNSFINLVVLSGQIGWVKIKYSSKTKASYVNFTVKQPELQYEKGVVVSQSYTHIFVTCFDLTVWSERTMKEGSDVVVHAQIKPFNLNGQARFNIIAEKIIILGNKKEESF